MIINQKFDCFDFKVVQEEIFDFIRSPRKVDYFVSTRQSGVTYGYLNFIKEYMKSKIVPYGNILVCKTKQSQSIDLCDSFLKILEEDGSHYFRIQRFPRGDIVFNGGKNYIRFASGINEKCYYPRNHFEYVFIDDFSYNPIKVEHALSVANKVRTFDTY